MSGSCTPLRSKMAMLAVVAAVALLILSLPVLLPHLLSALWMAPGEGGHH